MREKRKKEKKNTGQLIGNIKVCTKKKRKDKEKQV